MREFTRTDPEPEDLPTLADQQGHLWVYDDIGDEENGVPPGWANIPMDWYAITWRELFTDYDVTRLYELHPAEVRRLERELLGAWGVEG